MADIDYSKIPDEDLHHIANNEWEKVSDPVLRYFAGQPQGPAVKMPEATGLAGPVGTAITHALTPLDLLATGVSHAATATLDPVAGLIARATGQDPAKIHALINGPGTYHTVTPGGQAVSNAVAGGANTVMSPANTLSNAVESGVERATGIPHQTLESGASFVNDVAGSLPLAGAAMDALRTTSNAARATQVARGAADVAQEAGYTGLSTRADLKTPGAQAITDRLIAQDAGVVPGSQINVAAVQNARNVGPGRVYEAARQGMPAQLTQDAQLQARLGSLADSASQLPRSPDIEALRGAMLAQPTMTSEQLFSNIQTARQRAANYLASENPDHVALGQAYSDLANAYEDFAGRNLSLQSGVTQQQFQAARTQFAKNYLAEAALKGGEHFDPAVYGRAAQNAPDLLTGGGKVVADTFNGLPQQSGHTVARGVGSAVGALAGGALEHAGGTLTGLGPVGGAVVGGSITPGVLDIINRFFTRGNPAAAAAAPTNPRLSYIYDRGAAAPAAPAPLSLTPPRGPVVEPNQRTLGALPPGPAAGPPLNLQAPPGSVGVTPTQGGMELPPGPPARPPFELSPPLGSAFEPAQRPISGPFEPNREPMAQGQGLGDLFARILRARRHSGEPQ